jgi:glycerol-1-phosphatase
MAIIDHYAGIVFDIDGVLMRGETAVAGAGETLAALDARGVPTVYVTNNARRTPAEITAWLRAAGLTIAAERVVTSGLAAAALLPPDTACLVIGMAGLREALSDRGCRFDDNPATAEAVVVGFDRTLCWEDLRRATEAIVRGARFIGTNGDTTLPVENGIWPGNGAILAALEAATGVAPEIAGKPNAPLFTAAAERLAAAPLLMVGDRLETDIAGAAGVGWDSALVLTGVDDHGAAAAADPQPTYILTGVADLLR